MRIGLVVPGFSAHLADWCIPALRDLVGELATTSEIWVLALRYPAPRQSYEVFGARVQALGGGVRRNASAALLAGEAFAAIAQEHRRSRFDVLHAFWADEAGMIASVSGRILGVPTVVSIAGGELVGMPDIGYGGQLSPGQRLKVGLALRTANTVTGGSGYVLSLARRYLQNRPEDQVRQLPLGVDLRRFTRARYGPIGGTGGVPGEGPGRSVSAPRLIHVGSLVPVKDQDTLLRAASLLRSRGKEFCLDIVGSGPLESRLRDVTRQLRLEPNVRFHGSVNHDVLRPLYQRATAFVLTSRHESQCLAVLEAAACGVPCVGTRVGVVPELAPHAAAVVDVGDAAALANELEGLLGDERRRTSMGQAAVSMVNDRFSLERSTRAFRELYDALRARR